MTAVLHTWGSDLKYHVHAHCLVTFGGLSCGDVLGVEMAQAQKQAGAVQKTVRHLPLRDAQRLEAVAAKRSAELSGGLCRCRKRKLSESAG